MYIDVYYMKVDVRAWILCMCDGLVDWPMKDLDDVEILVGR